MRTLMQSSQEVVIGIKATRVSSNPSLNMTDVAFPDVTDGGETFVVANDFNSNEAGLGEVEVSSTPTSYAEAAGAVVEKVSVRFENTMYGYFNGKRIAFSVVEYYARNNWSKYGLKRIMMNAKGFFFYKLDTRVGLESILEGGPWMIPNSPIILKKWSMKTGLQKEKLTRIPIWVKLHDVPIQVFKEDDLDGLNFVKETIRVEYEWKPPRCHTYNIFGHTGESCNKKGVLVSKGFQVGKGFAFQPRAPNDGDKGGGGRRDTSSKQSLFTNNTDAPFANKDKKKEKDVVDKGSMKMYNIATPNPFAALGGDEDEEEDVENIWDESANLNLNNTWARTLVVNVPNVCRGWKWTSNGSLCSKGTRIILGWNEDIVDVMIMAQTNQDNLAGQAYRMGDKPWVLLGDFNATLNLEDHLCGSCEPSIAMREFKECVQKMEVMDVNSTGLHFTWNQKPKGSNGVLKKIDRIMCNIPFNDFFPKGFRFAIDSGWNMNVNGCAMYRVVKRLKGLKTPLRKLLHDQAVKEATLDEDRFLRQKSKVEWLHACDSNFSYFHRIVKSTCIRNRIKMVRDSANILHEGSGHHFPLDNQDLFHQVLDDQKAAFMVREAWDIVGKDVTCAIKEFFVNGKLLKELNHTIISLIPKVSTLAKVNDYRPISCCNVLYKYDLFLFTKGHPDYVQVIMSALEEFKNVLGLVPSFSTSDLVSSLILNGSWKWPPDWEARFPDLFHIQVLVIQTDREDVIMWRDEEGIFKPFYVACAWDTIRLRADVIEEAIAFIIPISKGKSVLSIISRIVLAATTYYLWNERNSRLFKKKVSSAEKVFKEVASFGSFAPVMLLLVS
uniref:DUF4283 domain-containing protein n=1 Tax=Tanacetum cinerariifolium TaxID=118510 RepID=A0A6L2K6G5_TANCI|nr:hypothetical protein [Tanacetum cinerariifolium]